MIGVIVPAHNEEKSIARCLASIGRAARDPALRGQDVEIVLAADACTDATVGVARRHRCQVLELSARCVGMARSLAADYAIARGARWIASTDADSTVPSDWLSRQLAYAHDAVCGTIRLQGAGYLTPMQTRRYHSLYHPRDGHAHVHGANLGVASAAYLRCGGFPHVSAHEDVGLIASLQKADIAIAWRAQPCVLTSGRLEGRAPEGLSAYLRALHGRASVSAVTS